MHRQLRVPEGLQLLFFFKDTEELFEFPEVQRPPGCKITAPNVSVQNYRCLCVCIWLAS